MKTELSEHIKAFRKERRLTQEQLAEAFGVTVGAVSKWEAGLSNPDISLLPELAEFFDTSLDVLLGYQVRSQNMQGAIEQIRNFRYQKEYDEGIRYAEKALKKYPDCFDIVYQSANLYYLYGVEFKKKESAQRALYA